MAEWLRQPIARRSALTLGAGALASSPLWAQSLVDLGFSQGDGRRPLTDAFPGKRGMILQRTRAPLLETPMAAFDGELGASTFTPNDRFFVRWHYADIPLSVDVDAFRLQVGGAVNRPLSLSLKQVQALPQVEIAAVNQCSGNSRGLFGPRVPGAQWGNGAIGNALWTGVRLRDLLERAGVAPGAVQVQFAGLDRPPGDAPWFAKSLTIDHARADEVIVAYGMNGTQLPLLNGFPLRLIVPGWFSTYWVKALDRITVLSAPDTGYWMDKAYRIPATPRASVVPGAKDFPTVPIGRMLPRAFFTRADAGGVRGIALGGDAGVAKVEWSIDGGKSWHAAQLGHDAGRYGFRRWAASVPPGAQTVAVRTTNTSGATQRFDPIWNPGGYMRNSIETMKVTQA
jgi:DMSO/TMAO reductase YedYZ molybdopterin-dependent catalytic subunit